jgi:hypothetical protein
MSLRIVVIACLVGAFSVMPGPAGWAAGSKDAVKRVEQLNEAAMTSYKAGDAEKARTQLMEAVVFGKESDLDTHPVMAKTYLNLALIHTEGLADDEKGKRYLSLARRINPKIVVPPELSDGEPGKGVVAEAMADKEKKDAVIAIADASDARRKERVAAAAAQEAKEREQAAASAAQAAKDREKVAAAEAQTAKQREVHAIEERERTSKDLATSRDAENKAREANGQLRKQIEEIQKELARTKDAEKRERDAKEQLLKAKAETDGQLVLTKDREKKEREAREGLQKELAAAKEREAKERAAREALEKEKQLAQTEEKERRAHDERERQERERLAEGPELPSQIPQPLYCPIGDEAHQNSELFVHCAAQPNVKARGMALYYRTTGSFHFNSLAMERSKKGWFVAAIPPASVSGKVLQYYAEAIDGRGDVVAANGKASSPNIVTLRPVGITLAGEKQPVGQLTRARAITGKPSSRPRTAHKDRAKTP